MALLEPQQVAASSTSFSAEALANPFIKDVVPISDTEHAYVVRMNDVREYPQILEIIAEVRESDFVAAVVT
jgi:hypothetical protein